METMLDAVKYVSDNHMEGEALKLANTVGDIYTACAILYKRIPQTPETIEICRQISKQRHDDYFDMIDSIVKPS